MKNTLKLAAVAASIFAATASHAANYVVAQCAAEQNGKALYNVMDRFEPPIHIVECFYGKNGNINGQSYRGAMAVNPDTHTPLSYHWKIDYQNDDQGNCMVDGSAKNCKFYKSL